MPHALLVDDDADTSAALAKLVGREGFSTATAGTLKEARAQLDAQPADVILMDLKLPDGSGIDFLKDQELTASTEVVFITGHASVDSAIEALRIGASDYLTKPVDLPRLKTILTNVARTRELKAEIGTLRAELRKLGRFGPLLGVSSPMQKVFDMIARVSPTEATVLLTGETGTGKDLTAVTIHELGRRRKGPFLALNCGAVAPNLIESELFGHERGSFTGADRVHRGYFERASGGTLFLDEISEMPIELQVKLLRVLETESVTRIGAERSLPVDVRVIAATNRRPEDAVADGKLREDLLYRLKVFPIHLPSLRERGNDLDLLAQHFLSLLNQREETAKQITEDAMQCLRAYAWPGNVRELKNVIQGSFILADHDLDPVSLPAAIVAAELSSGSGMAEAELSAGGKGTAVESDTASHLPTGSGSVLQLKVGTTIAQAERRLILATLNETKQDKKRAAEVLGISLKTLYNRLNDYKSEKSEAAATIPDEISGTVASRDAAMAERPDSKEA
jgi:DNA-binding NtrC family response regulator